MGITTFTEIGFFGDRHSVFFWREKSALSVVEIGPIGGRNRFFSALETTLSVVEIGSFGGRIDSHGSRIDSFGSRIGSFGGKVGSFGRRDRLF